MSNYEIIGVDNGYGFTKTVHSNFVTALRDQGKVKPPFMDNVITYNGSYYVVGGERMKVKGDKTVDDQTYILTLAAIGEELRIRNRTRADVILSVGLPLERCGEGSEPFKQYFKKENPVEFDWQDMRYTVNIIDVLVSPQGYSAIISEVSTVANSTVLVDIGSWTIDILQIVNNIPQTALSLNDGVITCILNVNDAIRKETGNEVMESQIQDVMMGKVNALPEKYSKIAQKEIKRYVVKIAQTLQEHKLNLETLPFIFVGGGANLIKNYGMHLFSNARIIPEINANVLGYEKIARQIYR